jgi:hypothetical protein
MTTTTMTTIGHYLIIFVMVMVYLSPFLHPNENFVVDDDDDNVDDDDDNGFLRLTL